jgi:hypothetical protein
MTPNQKQRIEQKIRKIRAALATERRIFGGYDDSRGLRYVPTSLYLKLQDFKGGLVYTRWFSKNFPDDGAFPDFLFEWAVILFQNGKLKEAERKAVETFFCNTYIFDKFFGRPIQAIDKAEFSNVDRPEYMEYFKYSCTQPELATFCLWLREFEHTATFKSVTKRFIEARIKLKDEHDPEIRHYLIQIYRELLNEI